MCKPWGVAFGSWSLSITNMLGNSLRARMEQTLQTGEVAGAFCFIQMIGTCCKFFQPVWCMHIYCIYNMNISSDTCSSWKQHRISDSETLSGGSHGSPQWDNSARQESGDEISKHVQTWSSWTTDMLIPPGNAQWSSLVVFARTFGAFIYIMYCIYLKIYNTVISFGWGRSRETWTKLAHRTSSLPCSKEPRGERRGWYSDHDHPK